MQYMCTSSVSHDTLHRLAPTWCSCAAHLGTHSLIFQCVSRSFCLKMSRADGETKAKGRASVKIVYQVWCIYKYRHTALHFIMYSIEHLYNSADLFLLQLQRLACTAGDVYTLEWRYLWRKSDVVGLRYNANYSRTLT
jgi:hypothetical protein